AHTVTQPPANTFSHMLEFDVILFKSCFPTSNIESDEQLEAYRNYHLAIRDVIDQPAADARLDLARSGGARPTLKHGAEATKPCRAEDEIPAQRALYVQPGRFSAGRT
ncbi:MAG: hypothetical protein IT323_19280, partial [Anaerolineae bacterium]|nr:hypothetical protein [Anaerolineae bacterium]